jgi:putative tryptophan/tyrosine transport system substrate-binding protein
MRRREFITLLGGGAAAWPIAASAQQPGALRRIGIVHDYNELDPVGRGQVVAFREALERLGWADGRNAAIEYKSGATDNEMLRGYATEMLSHKPDVVLTSGATITAALQRASRTVPIVFVNVTDPVGAGLVATLSRPGGNVTGFTQFEFGISAKWLELLKEMAPTTPRRVLVADN